MHTPVSQAPTIHLQNQDTTIQHLQPGPRLTSSPAGKSSTRYYLEPHIAVSHASTVKPRQKMVTGAHHSPKGSTGVLRGVEKLVQIKDSEYSVCKAKLWKWDPSSASREENNLKNVDKNQCLYIRNSTGSFQDWKAQDSLMKRLQLDLASSKD